MWGKIAYNVLSAASSATSVFFSATSVAANYMKNFSSGSQSIISYLAAAVHGVVSFVAKAPPSIHVAELEELPEVGCLHKSSQQFSLFGVMTVAWFMMTNVAKAWWLNLVAIPIMYAVYKTYENYNLAKEAHHTKKLKDVLFGRVPVKKGALFITCLLAPFALLFRTSLTFWFFSEAISSLLTKVLLDWFSLPIPKTILTYIADGFSGVYAINYFARYCLSKVYSLYEGLSQPRHVWPRIQQASTCRKVCGAAVLLLLIVEVPATNLGYAMSMMYALKKIGVIKDYSSTVKIITAISAIPATLHDVGFYMKDAVQKSILSGGEQNDELASLVTAGPVNLQNPGERACDVEGQAATSLRIN